jgi:hypothetical protein
MEIWRTGDATQRIFGMAIQGTTNVAMGLHGGHGQPDDGTSIRVVGTNGTAAANDILCYAMTGEVIQ